jgi:outer membrane protein OmpA-like peptidoglycan-associated protein
MGGDLAIPQLLKLERRQALMATMSLTYSDLFADPKSTPSTFELKAEGLAQLKALTKDLAATRLSMLMIEGHTDHNGPSDANQVESYQRATAVRQYLIDELGFDPKRVVAIGYGESEPADQSLAPGYVEANRRIVLKAIPLE